MKRLLCFFGIHWSGRTDGGAMGDALQCDICGCDHYGPGIVLFKTPPPTRDDPVVDYWLKHYTTSGLCDLCGNSGQIDTRPTARTAAGIHTGRVHYCICPNGQLRRGHERRQSPGTSC